MWNVPLLPYGPVSVVAKNTKLTVKKKKKKIKKSFPSFYTNTNAFANCIKCFTVTSSFFLSFFAVAAAWRVLGFYLYVFYIADPAPFTKWLSLLLQSNAIMQPQGKKEIKGKHIFAYLCLNDNVGEHLASRCYRKPDNMRYHITSLTFSLTAKTTQNYSTHKYLATLSLAIIHTTPRPPVKLMICVPEFFFLTITLIHGVL